MEECGTEEWVRSQDKSHGRSCERSCTRHAQVATYDWREGRANEKAFILYIRLLKNTWAVTVLDWYLLTDKRISLCTHTVISTLLSNIFGARSQELLSLDSK